MSETKLCRICLRRNAKVFDYDSFQLKYYYEQVMAKTVNDSDGLPHTFCYECATLLHKFHKFKEKCYKGEKALKDILKSGQITIKSVINSYIKRLNLQSPLHIITTNKQTKTCLVKHPTKLSDLIGPEENNLEQIEIISNSGGLVSDHSDNIDSDDTQSHREELIYFKTMDGKSPDPIKVENEIGLIKTEDLDDITTLSEVNNPLKTEVKAIDNLGTESEDDICNEVLGDVEKEVELLIEKSETESEDDTTCSEVLCHVEKEAEMPVEKPETKSENYMTCSKVLCLVEKEVEKPEIENEDDMSCSKVLCDVKKVKLPVKKAIGRKKKSRNEKLHQRSPRIYKKTKKGLDPTNWKQFSLTEDDAMKAFHANAKARKYLAAPFKCVNCYKPFLTQETLNRHTQLIHRETRGSLECKFCHMRFKLQCLLTRHIPKHYTKFECLRCSFVCSMEQSALLHEETHSGVKIKCKYCDEEFRHRSTYYSHMRAHRSDYICSLCGASFVSEAGVHLHKRVKHVDVIEAEEAMEEGKAVNTYCKQCDVRFDTEKALKVHLAHSGAHASKQTGDEKNNWRVLHPGKKKKPYSRRKRSPCLRIISEDGKDTSMYCERCDIRFETQKAYERHLLHSAMHPGGLETGDGKNSWKDLNPGKNKKPYSRRKRSPSLRIISEDGKDTSMYCERCDIRFETQKAYERHLLHSAMHPGGIEAPADQRFELKLLECGKKRGGPRRTKPTACRYCLKQFETRSACFQHHLAEHPRTPFSPDRHICEICGASLALGSMAKHLNSHTREIRFTCDTCGKQFGAKETLKRHQLTHTGEKPYPCTLCEKRFTQLNSMQLHYRTFHLKQPYPKRNRKKKSDGDDLRMEVESDAS